MKCRLEVSQECLECKARHCKIGSSIDMMCARGVYFYKKAVIAAGESAGKALHTLYNRLSKID